MTSIALIVAAGSGTRTGLEFPKQYLKIGKQTVLEMTARKFLDHPGIDKVLVVIGGDDRALYDEAIGSLDLLDPVYGGSSRQESVFNGLQALEKYAPKNVLIHDAARPFVDEATITRCLDCLKTSVAALPALPVNDTVKTISDNKVTGTLDRSKLVTAQTPQCFQYDLILSAHKNFKDTPVTDDIALAELAGHEITWIAGSSMNTKITTEEDVARLQNVHLNDIRTGFGYDVHAFDNNSDLWLGGVKVPYEMGLKGHSDADVALHALTDALLGAIGAGDIGLHFPPSDPKWKGAASDQFLAHAASLIEKRGGKIANIDLTIICEAPKISPHRNDMINRIAEILQIDNDRVSVKGTTTEKLGFTGRKEGIAAQAVATVRLPE